MRMMSIASGSSGNAIYAGSDTTHLLLDAGISKKRIEEGLNSIGLSVSDLSGVLISHEHSDHISSLCTILKSCSANVYATKDTIDAMFRMKAFAKADRERFIAVEKGRKFGIGDMDITPFAIPHDAADPVMYTVAYGKVKGAVATDLGEYDEGIVNALKGLDAIYLEANHDVRMLQTGPYPYILKQRILGRRGHLSNETAGRLLSKILCDKTSHVFLSHLSKENNLPMLAHEAVRLEVNMADTPYTDRDFDLQVAKRDEPSECIEL